MKKVSLMLGALALVLGISQCKKQESPVQAGEKQYIEVTASNGNDGSKVNVDFTSVPTVMNLTWEEGDVITVSGGAVGTLTLNEGAETAQGRFSGEIEKKNDNELVFSYKKAAQERGDENPNLPDFNAQDGTSEWIKNNLYLEAKANYNEAGKYSLTMEMPYAVLKLDLSALVGTQNDVTIKVGDDIVATVNNLAAANAGLVYVALPANGTEQTYTFSGNDKTGKKTWTLEASTYYTAEGGNAVVITAPFLFSVAEGVTVEFAPGNLWYGIADGESAPAFHFEKNQWDYSVGEWDETHHCYLWDASHVSHFCWSNTKDWQTPGMEPYAEHYSCSTQETDDVFFTEAEGFKVGNETGWRTLSEAEWSYLIGESSPGRDASLREWSAVTFGESGPTVNGLIIMPDGWEGALTATTDYTTWQSLESSGAVFLPADAGRNGMFLFGVGMDGMYWSSTPHEDSEQNAGIMYFNSDGVYADYDLRFCCYSVRLVR